MGSQTCPGVVNLHSFSLAVNLFADLHVRHLNSPAAACSEVFLHFIKHAGVS